jgi:hypothetical protein
VTAADRTPNAAAAHHDLEPRRDRAWLTFSVRGRQVSHREFNPTVGELPPILNDWYDTALRKLIDDFAGFAASRVNRQRKYLWLLIARHPVC